MSGVYTQGEERWAMEYTSVEAALAALASLGAKVSPRREPWRKGETKRGRPVGEYGVRCDATGWQGADILVEFDTGLAAVFGGL